MVLELVDWGLVGKIILAVLVIIFGVIFAINFAKKIIVFLISSFLGLAALWLIDFLNIVNIEINLWTLIIAAFGGVPGVILLVLLSYLGFTI